MNEITHQHALTLDKPLLMGYENIKRVGRKMRGPRIARVAKRVL